MILDTVHWTSFSEPAVNLSRAVGVNAPNQWGDVLLIQAMLHFIYYDHGSEKANFIWLGNFNHSPTGILDGATQIAMLNFQILHRNQLYLKALDGRFDAAHYEGRKLNFSKPLMAITLLHKIAVNSANKRGISSGQTGLPPYYPGLVKVTPKILAATVMPTKRSMFDGMFG
jgi:hypothetical protein